MADISPELVSVIDTAVKVGLGALISVLGAIALAFVNNSRSLEKERITRRRDLLEATVQELQKFTNAALAYWAVMSRLVKNRGKGEKEKAALAILIEKRAELNEASSSLTLVQGKILLLGDKEASDLLDNYGGTIDDFVTKVDATAPELDQQKLNEWRKIIKESRIKAIDRMAYLYNDPTAGAKS